MNGTYLNIDCMELMANLKDKEIDLAIVDPPYGIGFSNYARIKKGKNISKYEKKKWDSAIPDKEYFS